MIPSHVLNPRRTWLRLRLKRGLGPKAPVQLVNWASRYRSAPDGLLEGLTRVFSLLVLGLSLAGLAWLNRWTQEQVEPKPE